MTSKQVKHMQIHREALQRRTQQDWANREYVELMSSSITRVADFLNAFSRSCSGRLAHLDARLTALERKVTFLEAKVGIQDNIDELEDKTEPTVDETEDEEDDLSRLN